VAKSAGYEAKAANIHATMTGFQTHHWRHWLSTYTSR